MQFFFKRKIKTIFFFYKLKNNVDLDDPRKKTLKIAQKTLKNCHNAKYCHFPKNCQKSQPRFSAGKAVDIWQFGNYDTVNFISRKSKF